MITVVYVKCSDHRDNYLLVYNKDKKVYYQLINHWNWSIESLIKSLTGENPEVLHYQHLDKCEDPPDSLKYLKRTWKKLPNT